MRNMLNVLGRGLQINKSTRTILSLMMTQGTKGQEHLRKLVRK
jgi:hypothetical protein